MDFESAADYFATVAKPMQQLANDDPSSAHLACSAAVVVFSTADWIADERGEKLIDVIRKISDDEPDFEYLHATSNAIKHRKITRSPRRFIGLSNHVKSLSLSVIVLGVHAPVKMKLPDGRIVTRPIQFVFDDRRFIAYQLIDKCAAALQNELGL